MATYRKLKSGTRAEVYVKGQRDSKVLPTKQEAKDWAVFREAELRTISEERTGITNIKFCALMDSYEEKVSVHKAGYLWESKKIRNLKECFLAKKTVSKIAKADIARWRDDRLLEVSGSTVNRELNLLSHMFTRARDWGYAVDNPCSGVERPKENPARERVPTRAEIDALLVVSGWDGEVVPEGIRGRIMAAFLFCCECAMRCSEMCGIRPKHISDGRIVHLPKTKNGSKRDVALTPRAQEILKLVGGNFNLKPSQVDSNWRSMCEAALVEDLHFHDSRREGTTRMAKKLNLLDLARMTGHKNLKMLQIYYNTTADEIADRLMA